MSAHKIGLQTRREDAAAAVETVVAPIDASSEPGDLTAERAPQLFPGAAHDAVDPAGRPARPEPVALRRQKLVEFGARDALA